MEMNLTQLEDVLNKIKSAVEFYERNYMDYKSFTLYLGNGESIRYYITPLSLPHLLGIKDLEMLKQALPIKSENIIDILKELSEYAFQIHKKMSQIQLSQIFSEYITQKVDNFFDNMTYDVKKALDETEFVCKYKSKNSWEYTTKNQKCDYIIVKKLKNQKILFLYLVKNGSQYYPMSNQAFDNLEEARQQLLDVITNQEITLLTGICVYNRYSDNRYVNYLTINQKLEKLDSINTYKFEFESHVDISYDYKYTVERLKSSQFERIDNSNIVEKIVESMKTGKIISRDQYEDSILINIIDAWNDYICFHKENDYNQDNDSSYTKIIKELSSLKNVVESLKQEKITMTDKIKELTKENNSINEENTKYKENEKAIIKILKPEN